MSNRNHIHHPKSISALQARIKDQKAYLNRLTVQGIPTQAATDALNKLSGDLRVLQHR